MAIVYADNYTKAYRTSPPDLVHASHYGGKVAVFMDSYTASSLEAGSTIYCFRPPKGARWTGWGRLWSSALGTSVTLAVGIPGATTKFQPATSHASATITNMGAAAGIADMDYVFDGDTDVIITTGGGAATGTIKIMMMFSLA